jgi:hypothetical protein
MSYYTTMSNEHKPRISIDPDALVLFATNKQRTWRQSNSEPTGMMDLGAHGVNSISIMRSTNLESPAYVVLQDHVPTGRPPKVVGSILNVRSVRNSLNSLIIHWRCTNSAYYNHNKVYTTLFLGSVLSEGFHLIWNGLVDEHNLDKAFQEEERSIPDEVPARAEVEEVVVAGKGVCRECNNEGTLGEVCDNCEDGSGATYLDEGDVSTQGSNVSEEEDSGDISSSQILCTRVSNLGVSSQGNGDVDDAYDSEEVDMTQRYPEDHDYKYLAGMFFIKNKP